MTVSRQPRFLAWLTRPQFTCITVAAWFIIGSLTASHIPQWALFAIAGGIGVSQVLLNHFAAWLLHKTSRRAA